MLDNDVSISQILVSLESTFKIEVTGEATINDIVSAAIAKLENTYACTFDKDVYALQAENQLTAENINLLLKDVRQCLAMLSLYLQLKLFHKNMGITLADVNYLGYAKKNLLTSLKYLQDETQYKKHREAIVSSLSNTLNNISMCSVKRMFICLLVMDRLGISEGVAIMAELLYIGGLVE